MYCKSRRNKAIMDINPIPPIYTVHLLSKKLQSTSILYHLCCVSIVKDHFIFIPNDTNTCSWPNTHPACHLYNDPDASCLAHFVSGNWKKWNRGTSLQRAFLPMSERAISFLYNIAHLSYGSYIQGHTNVDSILGFNGHHDSSVFKRVYLRCE